MLAVVHRDVGVLDQLLRPLAVAGRAGDADAGRDREFVLVEAEGFGECLQDRVGQALGPRRFLAGVAHHQEFVAAEAGDHAVLADRIANAVGRLHQQFVAGIVAEHIVDHLEAIQIDVQHRRLRMRGIGQAFGDLGQHRVAVHQPGERIGAGLDAQGFLGLLVGGDVLQGAGDARVAGIAGFGVANHPDPERLTVLAAALQFQIEAAAAGGHALHRAAQSPPVRLAQAGQQRVQRVRRLGGAEDPDRLLGQVHAVAGDVPLPAADVGQRLGAIEQRAVALEFGHVAEERGDLRGTVAARQELRHRRDRQPDHLPALAVVHAQQRALDHVAGIQRPLGGQFVAAQFAPVRADHAPVLHPHLVAGALVLADAEDPHGRAVAIVDVEVVALYHDALVDGFHQLAVAHLGFPARADVARHRDDALAAVEGDVGRMHLDRETAAVAAHVGDLDDVGVTAVERFPYRHQVIARQVRVEDVDVLADDLLARAAISLHAGAVEIHHRTVLGNDADRIRHRVEQVAVALALGLGPGLGRQQRFLRMRQQTAGLRRQGGIGGGPLQGLEDVVGIRRAGDDRRSGGIARVRCAGSTHVAAIALPALLPVSRPSRAASQRPVSPRRSRSMPVAMPMPCSM